jgi:hypothetical protein
MHTRVFIVYERVLQRSPFLCNWQYVMYKGCSKELCVDWTEPLPLSAATRWRQKTNSAAYWSHSQKHIPIQFSPIFICQVTKLLERNHVYLILQITKSWLMYWHNNNIFQKPKYTKNDATIYKLPSSTTPASGTFVYGVFPLHIYDKYRIYPYMFPNKVLINSPDTQGQPTTGTAQPKDNRVCYVRLPPRCWYPRSLQYYAASSGNLLPTFRDNVTVPYSRVKEDFLTLMMGPLRCPETSVKEYHSTLRNIAEERIYRQDMLPECY